MQLEASRPQGVNSYFICDNSDIFFQGNTREVLE